VLHVFSKPLYSQTEVQKLPGPGLLHQLSLLHDNDFFTLTDRYYSSGLFLSYTKHLNKGFLAPHREQITVTLGQEVYTPSDIITTDISEQDRPYVGFLGLKGGWSFATNTYGLETSILIGLAGNNSGSGGFQRWYHKVFVVSDPPVWVGEMNNSLHVNSYVNYRREWRLTPNPFSVTMAVQPSIAFGTRDVYAQSELIAYFGRKDPMATSMAYQRIGSRQRELFFSFRVGYRYVAYDALFEGNLLGDTSVLLLAPNENLYYAGFDVDHRFGQNEYRFGYRLLSAAAPSTEAHRYVTLSYARNF
jgi:hypothetical protein